MVTNVIQSNVYKCICINLYYVNGKKAVTMVTVYCGTSPEDYKTSNKDEMKE